MALISWESFILHATMVSSKLHVDELTHARSTLVFVRSYPTTRNNRRAISIWIHTSKMAKCRAIEIYFAHHNYYSQPSKDARHFVTPVASKRENQTERENRAKPTSHDMMAGASLRVDCQPRNGFFFYSYFWKIGKFQTIDEPRHYFHCLFELGVGPEHFCFFVRNVTSTTSKRNDRKMWMKWWPKHFHFYMPISLGLHLLWHQWTRHAFVIVQTNS